MLNLESQQSESAARIWGAGNSINNHPCPLDQDRSKAVPSAPPGPPTLLSHLQNTQPLASPGYSSLLGKTVCLHCPGASRAFGKREAGQPSDQTQRLVKRQKQLKVFMNNAVPPSLPTPSQLCVVQVQINALPLCYAARLSQNFTERPRRKAPTIRGRLSENINAFLSQPVRPAADTNRHGKLALHPVKRLPAKVAGI